MVVAEDVVLDIAVRGPALDVLVDDTPEALVRVTAALHRARLPVTGLLFACGVEGGRSRLAIGLRSVPDRDKAATRLQRLVDVIEVCARC